MTKKLSAIISISFIIVTSLCGCQLAKEDAQEETTRDRLIGVYITDESSSLLNEEVSMEDNINYSVNGNDVKMTDDTSGKIYATEKVIDKDNFESTEFVFDGIEGIAFFYPTVYDSDPTKNYISSVVDPEVSNVMATYGNATKYEGTIYVDSSFTDSIFYLNRVYQTSDGQVYSMSNCGAEFSYGGLTQTISETYTQTIDGATENKSTEIIVDFEPINNPDKVIVKQMKDSDVIVTSTTITKGNVPKSISKDRNTAYVIVENHGYNLEGKYEITREILDNDENLITSYFMGEKGIAVGEVIELK